MRFDKNFMKLFELIIIHDIPRRLCGINECPMTNEKNYPQPCPICHHVKKFFLRRDANFADVENFLKEAVNLFRC